MNSFKKEKEMLGKIGQTKIKNKKEKLLKNSLPILIVL